jgi:hypothetical protein
LDCAFGVFVPIELVDGFVHLGKVAVNVGGHCYGSKKGVVILQLFI